MSKESPTTTDEGTVAALLQRANRRIPNLLAIRDRLSKGGTLGDIEIQRLESMIEGFSHSRALIDRHPEYQELVARVIALYKEITDLALANEEKGEVKPDIDLS
jgi:hypothetical protein